MATTYTRDRRFNHSTCLTCLTCTPELTANASESVLWRKISDYSQTEKSWTSEIFLECYCVARKKPIRREKTKPKARTLITVCGFVACSRALIFAVIGHNTITLYRFLKYFKCLQFSRSLCKSSHRKGLCHVQKVNMSSAQPLPPWKPACSSLSLL